METQRESKLGLTALVIGGVAALLCIFLWVGLWPLVLSDTIGYVWSPSLMLAVTALILGIVALVRKGGTRLHAVLAVVLAVIVLLAFAALWLLLAWAFSHT